MQRLTTTASILVFVIQILFGYDNVFLRLQPNFYDASTNSVYVDVEIKYDGSGQFVLADQNYRIYFDAASLKFDREHSNSDLPKDLYEPLYIHELIEDVQASGIDQLDFDGHLGFLNFSINLTDDRQGGIVIEKKHGWERVAVLKFELAPNQNPADIVWSRNGMTHKYATAFVQILEWISPNKTALASISQFYDTSVADIRAPKISEITLSPNPAIEYVKIQLDQQPLQDVQISISNSIGQTVYTTTMFRGSKVLQIPVEELNQGTYNIELLDTATGYVFTETFVKVGS